MQTDGQCRSLDEGAPCAFTHYPVTMSLSSSSEDTRGQNRCNTGCITTMHTREMHEQTLILPQTTIIPAAVPVWLHMATVQSHSKFFSKNTEIPILFLPAPLRQLDQSVRDCCLMQWSCYRYYSFECITFHSRIPLTIHCQYTDQPVSKCLSLFSSNSFGVSQWPQSTMINRDHVQHTMFDTSFSPNGFHCCFGFLVVPTYQKIWPILQNVWPGIHHPLL